MISDPISETVAQRRSCLGAAQVAAGAGPRKNAPMTKPNWTPAVCLSILSFLLFACASDAPPVETLKVGSTVGMATLLDQNDEPHHLDESVHFVFFAREMEGGAVIRALLDEAGPEYLTEHRVLYIADISGMPSLIANMIAIPKMQEERPYPTLLDRDGSATVAFPSEEGRVTVMALDRLRVKGIRYRGTTAGLREAVAKGN